MELSYRSDLANTEGSRRGRNERVAQKGVEYNLTITQTNDTELLYKEELQREKKKEKRKRGRENGWESRSERGDPFLGNDCGPFFWGLLCIFFTFVLFIKKIRGLAN